MAEELHERDHRTVNFVDPEGRTLLCCVRAALEHQGKEVVLLHPVDAPVEVFGLELDEEDEEILVGVEDEKVDEVLAAAKPELAKQGLTLELTALVPTVKGELPECDEEDIIRVEAEEEGEGDGAPEGSEEDEDDERGDGFQVLLAFEHAKKDYVVCTPIGGALFLARMNAQGQAELLPEEELEAVRQRMEQMFARSADTDSDHH